MFTRSVATTADPVSMMNLGVLYYEKPLVDNNYLLAKQCFELAAPRFVPAHFRLGKLYEMGLGVKVDLTKAEQYYLTAATLNNVNIYYHLGRFYHNTAPTKSEYYYRLASLGPEYSIAAMQHLRERSWHIKYCHAINIRI